MPGAVEMELAGETDTPGDSWDRFVVMNQEVELDVNFRDKSIQGIVKMMIFPLNDQLDSIRIDARQMEIDTANITVNQKKVRAVFHDPYENMDIPTGFDWDAAQYPYQQARIGPLLPRTSGQLPVVNRENSVGYSPVLGSLEINIRPEEVTKPTTKLKLRIPSAAAPVKEVVVGESHFEISIPFRSRRIRDGLHFVGVEETDKRYPHLYTLHSRESGLASCIFPCIDDPGARSYWTIRIKCPRTLGDALKQPLLTQRTTAKNAARGSGKGAVDVVSEQLSALTEEDKLMDMTVICAGMLIGEEIDKADESKKVMTFDVREVQISPQHVGFAVGPFQHVDLWSEFRSEEDDEKLGDAAIKIHGYCLPGREDEVRFTCEAMAGAADFFAAKFGKYPFDSYKMCFVEDMVSDTVPLYSFSLCSNRMLYPSDVIDTEVDVTRSLVHSLACQYFGVYIVPNTSRDAWITIGIAHFMTDLFMQLLCGNNDYRFRMKTRADMLVDQDVGRLPLDELGSFLHLGDYQMDFMELKAPLVLFILDKRLTKRATHNGLRRVISKIVAKAGIAVQDDARVVSSESFRKICEKISHNSASLEPFWQQWVMSSGCARFEITQKYNKKHSRVDVTIKQPEEKSSLNRPPLQKDKFWGVVQDLRHVPESKKENVSVWFTGPITIGIHEANGTPYEHVAEIRRMGPKMFKPIEMPYNTKYKRLKRTRRNRERAMANAQGDGNAENLEDAVLYSLGDVLQTPEEVSAWKLADWTPEQEKSMEHDSFEWLRLDADFEWICSMKTNMQPWMYVSQLQQDRDVVAQQDSVLYMSSKAGGEIAASVLARTLMDPRYFHGIRTQAVTALQKQAWPKEDEVYNPETGQTHKIKVTEMGGMGHLIRAFKKFFCYPDTQTPRPNDFSNKMQYFVQRAIPAAVARVRDKGRCPPEAKRFILEQLRFNNNSDNEYSDHFYVASLLDALATSLVPEQQPDQVPLPPRDDDPAVVEDKAFLAEALVEIERYLRMDEWTNSYQNIWTRAALGCKQKLMKARVIPISPMDFVQYLQDGTLDLVQIKAFEALVDLGSLLHKGVLRLLLAFMTTHHSPFVRDRLFKVFCAGVAGWAFGEYADLHKPAPDTSAGKRQQGQGQPAGGGGDDDDDDADADADADDVLMMEHADVIIEKKKAEEARRQSIQGALQALQQEVSKLESQSQDLWLEIWKAISSPVIGLMEQRNILDMCQTLFQPDYSCRITVRHPTMWSVDRIPGRSGHPCLFFKAVPRPFSKRPIVEEPPPPPPPPQQGVPEQQGLAPVPTNAMATTPAAAAATATAADPFSVQMKPTVTTAPGPSPAQTPTIQRQPSKIKLVNKGAASSNGTPVTLAKGARASISVASPGSLAGPGVGASISVVPSPQNVVAAAATSAAGLAGAAALAASALPSLSSPENQGVKGVNMTTGAGTAKTPKPKKRKLADDETTGAGGRPRKMLRIRCPGYFYRLEERTQKAIMESGTVIAAAASPGKSAKATPGATPSGRKPLPSGPSSTAVATEASASPSLSTGRTPAIKVRKPLPSAAPMNGSPLQPQPTAHVPAPAPAPAHVIESTTLPPLAPQPGHKKIKIKIGARPKPPQP